MRRLTDRQREVLSLIAQGKRVKQLGPLLGISRHGVDDVIEKIKHNLGAATLPHAVLLAVGAGMLEAPILDTAVERPGNSPLTPEQVRAIREGRDVGVSYSSRWRVLTGRRHSEIK